LDKTTAKFGRPEDYAETFSDTRASFTLTASGRFRSRVTQHRLADANLRLAEAIPSHLLRVVQPPRAIFVMRLGEGPPLVQDGMVLRPGEMACMPSSAQILSWSFDWDMFHIGCRP